MKTIYMLWKRELKRHFRSRLEVVANLVQPLLYLLTLGFGFTPVFEHAGRGSYIQFMTPGIVGMNVLFVAAFAGMGVLWDRQYGLKQALVAPVPRFHVMLGRTLGSATAAVAQGLFVLIMCAAMGFRPSGFVSLLAGVLVMSCIAVAFAGLGTAIGSVLKSIRTFSAVISFAISPLTFVSGAFTTLEDLPAPLRAITSANPFAYGVDGLRATLNGMSHFGLDRDVAVLLVTAAVFTSIGAWAFSRIQL